MTTKKINKTHVPVLLMTYSVYLSNLDIQRLIHEMVVRIIIHCL